MVLWFIRVRKNFSKQIFEKKIRNSLLVDGDKVRKYISKDLSYKLKDRKIQIDRVLGITKLSIESKYFNS